MCELRVCHRKDVGLTHGAFVRHSDCTQQVTHLNPHIARLAGSTQTNYLHLSSNIQESFTSKFTRWQTHTHKENNRVLLLSGNKIQPVEALN